MDIVNKYSRGAWACLRLKPSLWQRLVRCASIAAFRSTQAPGLDSRALRPTRALPHSPQVSHSGLVAHSVPRNSSACCIDTYRADWCQHSACCSRPFSQRRASLSRHPSIVCIWLAAVDMQRSSRCLSLLSFSHKLQTNRVDRASLAWPLCALRTVQSGSRESVGWSREWETWTWVAASSSS